MIIDFLCVAVPLPVFWYVYEVPISILEMLSITMMPTFSMVLKLGDIFKETVLLRAAHQVLKEQSGHALSMRRGRRSVFEEVAFVEMAKVQQDRVPRQVRLFVAGSKGLFGLFFLVVAVVHLATQPAGCDTTTWDKGCVNKIPFCKSLFTPTCNCASLRIVNNFTLTALPDSFVDEMQGLRKVFIRNCSLTALPPRMERLAEMVDFEVSFNQLRAFDVDVLKWEKLDVLYLMNNNITGSYNKKALWTHPNLAAIAMGGNEGLGMPTAGIYMPSLSFLDLRENRMDITTLIEADAFPQLLFLYLSGNNLKTFPSESLKVNLMYLGIARCNLKSLRNYLSDFQKLQYLDARNNNITFVNDDLKELIATNDVEAYFSGNMVCRDDTSLDCQPLCSETCWHRDVLNNGQCDLPCNSKECDYDGGSCDFF